LNKNILDTDVQKFINDHLNDDINKLLLGKSPFPDLTTRDLAQQIDSKKRSEKKLPLWFNTPDIFFPPKLNVEQASSELTAAYKSKLIKGSTLADLTGGFGVDDYFFSKSTDKVYHFELNEELSEITKHNSTLLGASNIEFIVADSIEYLKNSSLTFNTIYVDPARRVQSKKVFLLKDTEPDVVSNLSLLQQKSERIIIKTSPLFDIQSGLNELQNVSEVHVVSLKNDCKELLWVIDKEFNGEPEIICAALGNSIEQEFKFKLSEEREISLNTYAAPSNYLFEPDVALLKAGAFKSVALKYNVSKLHQHTHLYTSENICPNFIGRTFEVKNVFSYKQFAKENSLKKANIICRNFPLSPEELKKKHKIQDGGEGFLIFCTCTKNELIVVQGIRLT